MPLPNAYECFSSAPVKTLKHSTYFAVYDREFAPYRNRAITLVEIGVAHGGSLFMWRKFFGTKARIIGIDINPQAQKWVDHGFEIHIGDQSDPAFWAGFFAHVGNVDIVIDDGGHTYHQQIITADSTVPHIKDGGLLLIEDSNTSYLSRFGAPSRYSFIAYAKQKIDRIHHRFSGLDPIKADWKIYTMRFYESIVVFEINRKHAKEKSHWAKSKAPKDTKWNFYMAEAPWVRCLRHRLDKWGWFQTRYRLATGIMLRANTLARRIENRRLQRFFRDK